MPYSPEAQRKVFEIVLLHLQSTTTQKGSRKNISHSLTCAETLKYSRALWDDSKGQNQVVQALSFVSHCTGTQNTADWPKFMAEPHFRIAASTTSKSLYFIKLQCILLFLAPAGIRNQKFRKKQTIRNPSRRTQNAQGHLFWAFFHLHEMLRSMQILIGSQEWKRHTTEQYIERRTGQ